MSGKAPYAQTHNHPTHIDIPSQPPSALEPAPDDLLSPQLPSASRPAPPRGILKNPLRSPSGFQTDEEKGMAAGAGLYTPSTDQERLGDHNLKWDEKNLADTEMGKDAFMKIDEPKTPYVWNKDFNDSELGDVPDFDLISRGPNSPLTPASPNRSIPGTPSSLPRRPSSSASSSSRSASFSLPSKPYPVRPGGRSSSSSSSAPSPIAETGNPLPIGATAANTNANMNPGAEVFDDSDEENMDPETREKHRRFEEKRAGHYGNEAKIALQRAKELMKGDEGDGDGEEEVDMDGE